MNELIWFSIPGAIVLGALGIAIPPDFYDLSTDTIPAFIVAIPVLGFIIHQLWRTIFEFLLGGYASEKTRTVISDLMKKYGLTNKSAYLVWELTFYSDKFPDSFRQHNRGAWHYIMSFSSCALACLLALIIVAISCICFKGWIIILFLFLCVMFFIKAWTTLKSINSQESAMLMINGPMFEEKVTVLKGKF